MKAHTASRWCWRQIGKGWAICTPDRACLIVMDFVRNGMQGAQPRFAVWPEAIRGRMGGIMKPASEIDILDHPDACKIIAAPLMYETLMALKVRISYIGTPGEKRYPDGSPDWKEEIGLLEAAQAQAEGREL